MKDTAYYKMAFEQVQELHTKLCEELRVQYARAERIGWLPPGVASRIRKIIARSKGQSVILEEGEEPLEDGNAIEAIERVLNKQAKNASKIQREERDGAAEREVFARLLEQVPAETVMFKTISGERYTAGELLRSLRAGEELGRQYASDVLRICRDMLMRSANRKDDEPSPNSEDSGS